MTFPTNDAWRPVKRVPKAQTPAASTSKLSPEGITVGLGAPEKPASRWRISGSHPILLIALADSTERSLQENINFASKISVDLASNLASRC